MTKALQNGPALVVMESLKTRPRPEEAALVTTEQASVSAWRASGAVASGLPAKIKLVTAHDALRLGEPSVDSNFFSHRLNAMAEQSQRHQRGPSQLTTRARADRACSIAVVRSRWAEMSTSQSMSSGALGRQLQRRGHQIVFTELERTHA